MKEAAKSTKMPAKQGPVVVNRWAYGLFVLVSIYFFVKGDLGSAVSNFGIALVFDPFDKSVTSSKRPMYQRIWMIVHLLTLFIAFGFLISGK